MISPIRIFVGCASNNEDLESQAVLEYSIRKNTGAEVEINWMQLSKDPASPFFGWKIESWTTPFSGFRWIVPHLCEFYGEAIYMDSDIICRGDVADLWNLPIAPDKIVVAKGGKHPQRLCVCKWDCKAAKVWLPRIEDIKNDPNCHRFLMGRIAKDQKLVQTFDPIGNWNALDLEPGIWAEDVKAIHYTGIPTHLGLKHSVPRLAAIGQRHWFTGIPRSHPDQKLQQEFDRLLSEARETGFAIECYEKPPFGKYGLNRYPI